MGHNMARFLQRKRVAVLMLGLENSGKTTILYKLLTGEKVLPVPTFGFNMEILPFDDIELDVMDVGGDHRIVPLWKHYLISAAALIYVVDCCDVNRMEENKTLLADIVSRPERKGVPLLVIVNKTDSLGYDLTPDDLQLRLDLQMNCKLRPYRVQMVSAETGDGLSEAFTWLCATLGSGYASKQLKRISEQARREKEAVINKRRRIDSLCDEYYAKGGAGAEEVAGKEGPVAESQIETPLATPNYLTATEGRLFSFSDTYERINAFFKSRSDDMGPMLSGAPKTPTGAEKLTLSEREDVHMSGDAVDTLSSNPHKPLSPRRLGSMMRLQEFIESRNVARSRADTRRKEQGARATSSSAPASAQSTPRSHTEEFSFTRLFSFFTRNPSLASESDDAKQSSLPSPRRVPRGRSAAETETTTRSTSLPHMKARNVAVSKSDSVYWRERHRKRVSVDDSLDGSPIRGASVINEEESKKETPLVTPRKSARPSILSVLASIRLSLGLLRRGSKDEGSESRVSSESPVKVGKSVFHISQQGGTSLSVATPVVTLQPPSPTES